MSLAPPSTVGDRMPTGPMRAVRRRLDCTWSPTEVALARRDEPHGVALVGTWFDGSAIVAARPIAVMRPEAGVDPFVLLDSLPPVVDAPDSGVFGGWIGYLGYQAGGLVERLPVPPPRPHRLPEWWFGWYDHVLRCDRSGTWWLEALVPAADDDPAPLHRHHGLVEQLAGDPPRPNPVRWTPFRPTPSGDDHRKAIERALELIGAGDIYQANVCLRLSGTRVAGDPIDVFARGVDRLAPPYSAHLDLGAGSAITSFSPERFLRRRDRSVDTSPIKGTRPRDPHLGAEDPGRRELATSAKERAENVMIVDLMRNDLGRVCVPGSICVPRLLDVEPHPGVWHLVSDVVGELNDGVGDGSLLRATFPPGSVTGTPKVRAMEVIAEVERTAREVYTGAIGMVSPVAGAEWNVAIRTFEHRGPQVWLGVGGGIVADSDPWAESAECTTKASPLVEAVGTSIETGSL